MTKTYRAKIDNTYGYDLDTIQMEIDNLTMDWESAMDKPERLCVLRDLYARKAALTNGN